MTTQLIETLVSECEARKSHLTEVDERFIAGLRAKLTAGEEITPREYRQLGGYAEFIGTHEPDEKVA